MVITCTCLRINCSGTVRQAGYEMSCRSAVPGANRGMRKKSRRGRRSYRKRITQ